MFLSAVGTVDIGFTIKPSYGLLLLALAAGFPWMLDGWLHAPRRLRQAALILIAVYVLAALLGHPMSLASQTGRSTHRAFAYLADLFVGLGAMGLVSGITHDPNMPIDLKKLAKVVALGAVVGGLLGLYQWLARHFGWPLSDLNNAVNSDGFSYGHRYQGAGLLGWERARGTFKEPLAMATFLGASLPVVGYAALSSNGRSRVAWSAGSFVVVAALAVSDSTLGWAATLTAAIVAAVIAGIARGDVRLAAMSGALVPLLVLIPLGLSDPAAFSAVTGRAPSQLATTMGNRTGAWGRAIDIWEQRPLIGDGPGESAIRLAYRPDGGALRAGLVAPLVLGSAQGLWAAALVDGGIIEFLAWAAFFVVLLVWLGKRTLRRPAPLALAALAGAVVYIVLAQVSGDRLDIEVWFGLGLALAASRESGKRQR